MDMAKKSKPPAGNTARMSRPQPPESKPSRRSTDPKADYSKEQLAEIGAIAIVWNHIDDFVDWLLQICLGGPIALMWAVGRSIGSVEAKLDLLTLAASRSRILNDEARACIGDSFSAIKKYKTYRDRIVHSVPYNVDLGIAHSMDRKAKMHQSLVTIEALSALYERMKLLLDELPEIDLLFRLSDEEGARKVYQANPVDPIARRRDHDVSWQTAKCRERQNVRLSLPPLPFFPDEPLS
jgi:hypothetical protein